MACISADSDSCFTVPRGRCLECGQLGLTNLYPMPIHDDRCGECMEHDSYHAGLRQAVIAEFNQLFLSRDAAKACVEKIVARRLKHTKGVSWELACWGRECVLSPLVYYSKIVDGKMKMIPKLVHDVLPPLEGESAFYRSWGPGGDFYHSMMLYSHLRRDYPKHILEQQCRENGITPRKSWTRKQLVQALMKV